MEAKTSSARSKLNVEKLDCSWLICSNKFDDQLRGAIQSCADQESLAAEIIVVCNGASCAEVARDVRLAFGHDPSLTVLQTEVVGLIFSLNLGIHFSRTRYIVRMDADDIAYASRLKAQFDYMEEHRDVAVCGTDYDLIDDTNHVITSVQVPHEEAHVRAKLVWTNPFCHPTTIIRKHMLLAVGGYLGGLFAEDYDLWVRMSRMPGYRLVNLPVTGMGYRAVPHGEARRARAAYASVAATQFRCFAQGFGLKWGLAAIATAVKGYFRSRRETV